LLHRFDLPTRDFIERNIDFLTLLVTAMLIRRFFLVRLVFKPGHG